MRAVSLLLAFAVLAGACTSGRAWPRVISTSDVRSRPMLRGEWIASYDTALVTIADIMRRDLGLPELQAALHFYRDRKAFESALLAEGYDDQLAADAAATLTAIGGFRRVLLNDAGVRSIDWPYRIALLAHELTHTLQYEFSGGRRGTSDQWLREGFAEWVEVHVLTALELTTRDQARAIAAGRVRAVRTLPSLGQMVTFPEWVALARRVGSDAIYAQALMAAEFLVERHGVPAVIVYFQLFAESNDRLANFRRAFGEDLQAFEGAFRIRVTAAVR